MGWLLPSLAVFLLGFLALLVLFAGWVVWLPVVARVAADHGTGWGLATFVPAFLAAVGVGAALFRAHDALARRLDPRGRALPDETYCRGCGFPRPARFALACPICGERFGG